MSPPNGKTLVVRLSGWLTLLSFALYLANILQGKARVALDWQPLFRFGDVTEFLLLLLTATGFTVTILVREARSENQSHVHSPEEQSQ